MIEHSENDSEIERRDAVLGGWVFESFVEGAELMMGDERHGVCSFQPVACHPSFLEHYEPPL